MRFVLNKNFLIVLFPVLNGDTWWLPAKPVLVTVSSPLGSTVSRCFAGQAPGPFADPAKDACLDGVPAAHQVPR
jgi:hypothetical protein